MASIFRAGLLEGKVAFVTGGGSGIGATMARRFAEHGAKVMLVGRRRAQLEEVQGVIHRAGGIASVAPLDVRDYQALAAAFHETKADLGPVDIVLAAAAGNFPARALDISANGFKAVVDIDLLGTFNTMRAGYDQLRRPGASIVAISAAQATVPMPGQAHVCAAKAGVEQLMKTLAIEWGPAGVRSNCIVPGPTEDTEGMRRLAPTEEVRERVRSAVPLRRFGTKDELADLAVFLCSDAAGYITGATFACDGGSELTSFGPSLA